jgi:hypothetical protein
MNGIHCGMASLRDAALLLLEALNRLEIHYAIGGSFASSFHGVARATQDLNLVVELPMNRVRDLYLAVSPHFYADEETMLDAIRRGLSFNLIHLDSGFKFDLFMAGRRPLGRDQLRHRRRVSTALLGGDPLDVDMVSAKDIILAKLLWYRAGGDVSERQWNDLVNLVQVQADKADRVYLEAQAARLGLADLLARLWKG